MRVEELALLLNYECLLVTLLHVLNILALRTFRLKIVFNSAVVQKTQMMATLHTQNTSPEKYIYRRKMLHLSNHNINTCSDN